MATLAATCSAGARPGDTLRLPDSRGNLVFWIGAAAASLNVIAMLTVAVAMLAATGVRRSVETAQSRQPAASSQAFHGSGE